MNFEEVKCILEAAKAPINRHIFDRTVVLAVHDEKRFTKHGTGMLLQINGHHIVITAAHVIKNVDPKTIQLITTENLSNLRFTPEEGDLYGGAADQDLDVGFLRIGDSASPLLHGKQFLTLDDFDLFPTELSTDVAILFGMPGAEHTEPIRDDHSFSSFTYMTNFPEDLDWNAPGNRPTLLEIGYEEEVEDAFTGKTMRLPEPYGMSGGGLWRTRFAGSSIWAPQQLRLVGILTEFHKDLRTVRANRVENLYHLLSHHFELPQLY